jgi:hypothetical protein
MRSETNGLNAILRDEFPEEVETDCASAEEGRGRKRSN